VLQTNRCHDVAMTDGFVVRPDAGRLLDTGTFEAVVLATGTQTDQAFSLLRTQGEPPGFGPPMHVHHDAAEAFYVLEGQYQMFMDDHQELCPPGTFVYVPTGVAHTFRVVSPGPGRKLNIFAPGAMVGFFEELAEAEAAGGATAELVDVIAARHQMEVVGPVPRSYLHDS
jgi:mannose-6-phosphate isomerase-like protein (cupin superfamily)